MTVPKIILERERRMDGYIMNDYLYHYTTVSSLALILKNRNIRFSPLSQLDDLEEERVLDQQSFGKYCFVSSWTLDEKESIPMWNMYTLIEEGNVLSYP